MLVYVFGTGFYYNMYRQYIDKEIILNYLDNDPLKQGKFIEGIEVISPKQADYNKVEYILILIDNNQPIVEQLISYGVEQKKIRTYRQLNDVLMQPIIIKHGVDSISADEYLNTYNQRKRVLLLSHDFSRTGVPVAVMHMAELFEEMGIESVVGALIGGSLEEELCEKKIRFINNLHVISCDAKFERFINHFNYIFIGTITVAGFAHKFSFFNKPIIWWFNERYIDQYKEFTLPKHKDNMFYYADGDNTIDVFKSFYPERNIELLYYFLPDDEMINHVHEEHDYIQFLFAAFLSRRKGHDIFLDAIKKIPSNKREKFRFVIVGQDSRNKKDVITDWNKQTKEIPQIIHYGEVSQRELNSLYMMSDVFVCSSRDDTIPIVVTQAFEYSMPCIVTDIVGQSKYMENGYAGFVFSNEDSDSLCKYMLKYADNKELLKTQGKQAREIFEIYFSKKAVKDKMKKILTSISKEK